MTLFACGRIECKELKNNRKESFCFTNCIARKIIRGVSQMLGYLGSFSDYFFEKPVTHIFHNFSVYLGAPANFLSNNRNHSYKT